MDKLLCRFYLIFRLVVTSVFLFALSQAHGQSPLDKKISVDYKNSRLADALKNISNLGGFHFSYSGLILPKDSLISVNVTNEPIGNLLRYILHNKYTYTQSGNYIIITHTLKTLSLINTDVTNDENSYSVSGIIIDEHTGDRLMNASVYEKRLLLSALTDEHGYFKLRFNNRANQGLALTVSKTDYRDTTMMLLSSVTVQSRSYVDMSRQNKSNRVEHTAFGRILISTKQKIQSLNIPDFFAKRPFQVSLTPGLSTHGLFSSQVVNKVSINLGGGYSAGVNGVEFGGLFNIDKNNVKYLQLAGAFNLTGGSMTGLQAAIVHNRTLDTMRGVQLAAFFNQSEGQVSGMQLSALHNSAHKLKGLQIGLVNIADTSEGMSIGLLNIIRNGFYRVSLSANNLTNTNVTLKTGTHNFYSLLTLGANISANQKLYAFGIGIGHDFMLGQRTYFSAEADYQFANTGLWDDRWAQFKLLLNIPIYKNISFTGGPTYSKYSHTGSQPGYRTMFRVPDSYVGRNPVKRFVGWEAGLTFTSSFKAKALKTEATSKDWHLAIAATTGVGWDEPLALVTGGELQLQKDLGEGMAATLSIGGTSFSLKNRPAVTSPVIINGKKWQPKSYYKYPIKAGMRLKVSTAFYVAGEAGLAWGTRFPTINMSNQGATFGLDNGQSFVYAFTGGFAFKNGLDAGLKFEDYDMQGNLKQFALRLAYRIKLNN